MDMLITLLLVTCSLQNAHAQSQESFLELLRWNYPIPNDDKLFPSAAGMRNETYLQEISEHCAKKEFYVGLNPRHMKAMTMVANLLMEQLTPSDCIEMAGALRDLEEINPHAWLRAVISAIVHRRDMQGLRVPPIVEVMPSLFIPSGVLEELESLISLAAEDRHCVLVDGSVGRDNGPDNLLWYFREDVTVNSHHWYWHLSYPTSGARGRRDRSGELFYFMHHDFLARYHTERLSVGLTPIRSYYLNKGFPIPGHYDPHMHDGNSGIHWSPRPIGVRISDIDSDIFGFQLSLTLRDRGIQLRRIANGTTNKFLIDRRGHHVPLDNDLGITLLSNTVEANVFSVNRAYYGFDNGVHNDGHLIISLALDPKNERDTIPTVMADTATSMREPIFYGYHESIDDIFKKHKDTFPPYQLTEGSWPLALSGITLRSLKVQSGTLPPNELQTFWGISKHDLSRGFDFSRDESVGPLWTCLKHLDHQDFEYELQIERGGDDVLVLEENVTVRLYMGPRYNSNGIQYKLEEQRLLMFVLDTFTVPLQYGMNTIRRNSTETPLTILASQGIGEFQGDLDDSTPQCGCGWPHHLLLPKGTEQGMIMDLFAIITSGQEDYVESVGEPHAEPEGCRSAYMFCGIVGEKYPDKRPMGYPFDRKLYISAGAGSKPTLENLVQDVPNSASAQVKICHFNEIRNPGHPEKDLVEAEIASI